MSGRRARRGDGIFSRKTKRLSTVDGLFAFLTPGLQTRSTVVKPSEARNAVVLAAQAPRAAFHHGLAAARADDARHDAGAGGCGIGDLLDAEDLLEGRIENALDHFGVKALVAGLLLGRHQSAREGEGLEDTGFLGLASGHEAGDVDEADGAVVASTPEGEGHLAVVAMDEVALAEGAADERADIDEEIDFIFHRAGLLRNGELCVVLSAVVSGLMVALCVLEESTGVHADFVNSMLLVAAVGLIVLSTVFLSLEIRLSLKAIKVVVSKLPPVDEAFDDAAAARAAQAVEARHQSHMLNEARHASEGRVPHEVRKVEEKR
mgnify:CR=1 FL=1